MLNHKTSMPIVVMALVASAFAVPSAGAFSMKGQTLAQSEDSDVNNRKFEQAAMLDAKAYLCGTDSAASESAMKAGMAETGLPEDIAVEVVSDLASGIIDKAMKSGSKEICGKPQVQMSRF